ncbi:hypothetical protein C1H46_023875 [Malus baccata]|uniref:Uncharacterized protein n=1 Tax=Malus baccata TaxID=106549 RepID=A0A540LVP0_MALBA|nr:hypothetical protein C1H46_023870 [Malus baccata]TQD90581.1 hypothetical protein C1H46_023875 [Malus baccata]
MDLSGILNDRLVPHARPAARMIAALPESDRAPGQANCRRSSGVEASPVPPHRHHREYFRVQHSAY